MEVTVNYLMTIDWQFFFRVILTVIFFICLFCLFILVPLYQEKKKTNKFLELIWRQGERKYNNTPEVRHLKEDIKHYKTLVDKCRKEHDAFSTAINREPADG